MRIYADGFGDLDDLLAGCFLSMGISLMLSGFAVRTLWLYGFSFRNLPSIVIFFLVGT